MALPLANCPLGTTDCLSLSDVQNSCRAPEVPVHHLARRRPASTTPHPPAPRLAPHAPSKPALVDIVADSPTGTSRRVTTPHRPRPPRSRFPTNCKKHPAGAPDGYPWWAPLAGTPGGQRRPLQRYRAPKLAAQIPHAPRGMGAGLP